MPFSVDPGDPRPIYVQIMDEIRRGVAVGSWDPGMPLPSAKELAVELRVNPNTVQKAYRELKREGVVEGRRGSGTYVREGIRGRERRRLVAELADRTAREAHRSGVTIRELVDELLRRPGASAGAAEAAG